MNLTPHQVDTAMTAIRSNWANQALSDSVRDTWLRLLPKLEQGEFTPALDAWLLGPRARFRPEPGEFMELAVKNRPGPLREYDVPHHVDPPMTAEERARSEAASEPECFARHAALMPSRRGQKVAS